MDQLQWVEPAVVVTWIRWSPSHCSHLGEVPTLLPIPTIHYIGKFILATSLIRPHIFGPWQAVIDRFHCSPSKAKGNGLSLAIDPDNFFTQVFKKKMEGLFQLAPSYKRKAFSVPTWLDKELCMWHYTLFLYFAMKKARAFTPVVKTSAMPFVQWKVVHQGPSFVFTRSWPIRFAEPGDYEPLEGWRTSVPLQFIRT